MAWVIVNRAEDGRHIKSHTTHAMASQALRDLVGRREGLTGLVPDGTEVVSDYGNVVQILQMPKGMTGKLYEKLMIAADARECGSLTAEQTALLAKHGW